METSIKFYLNYLVIIALITITVITLFADISEKPKPIFEKPATTGEFPYHVSIQVEGKHEFSGALISKKHVLTTGVQVYYLKEAKEGQSKVQVAVGMIKVPGGTLYAVKDMNYHPEFKYLSRINDLAVIRLVEEISMSKNIRPVELPKANYKLHVGQRLFISTFGFTSWGTTKSNPSSHELKKLLISVSHTFCDNMNRTFCTYVARKHTSYDKAAVGDIATVNKKTIIGIFSLKRSSGADGRTIIFTYVPAYLPFIESQMNIAD